MGNLKKHLQRFHPKEFEVLQAEEKKKQGSKVRNLFFTLGK